VTSISIPSTLLAQPCRAEPPSHSDVLRCELVSVLAVGFQGLGVGSADLDLTVHVGTLCLCLTGSADPCASIIDEQIVATQWVVSALAMRLAAVVAPVLLSRSDGLQVAWCSYAIGIAAPTVPDVIDRQALGNRPDPEFVGVAVGTNRSWLACFRISIGELTVALAALVDLSKPAPAPIGVAGLVDLADEQFVASEPVRSQLTGGEWVSVSAQLLVVAVAQALGLGALWAGLDTAEFGFSGHSVHCSRGRWSQFR